MLPIKDIRLSVGEALAADAAFLAPVAANKIKLIKAAFTPGEDLVFADIVLADFDGSTAITGVAGAQQVGTDPLTGAQQVTLKEPAGGWRFITTGVTNLPQDIWGWALLDNAATALLGTELLPQPITLEEVGQEINLGVCKLVISQAPFNP